MSAHTDSLGLCYEPVQEVRVFPSVDIIKQPGGNQRGGLGESHAETPEKLWEYLRLTQSTTNNSPRVHEEQQRKSESSVDQ